MRNKSIKLAGFIAAAALLLTACGAPAATNWPGLAADNDYAYLAEGNRVRAVTVNSGSEKWAFPAGNTESTETFVSEPGVSPTLVAVGSEGPRNSYSGLLFGLERETGIRKWCLAFDQKMAEQSGCSVASLGRSSGPFGLPTTEDRRLMGGITLVDEVVYFGLANGSVFAVEVASGKVRWEFDEPQRDIWAAPVVADQIVIVASLDHHVYAVDRGSGRLIWKRDLGAALAGTPTLADGTLYVGTFGNYLIALDPATGNELGKFTASNWVWNGPAVSNGKLYFTDVGGTVYSVDAASLQAIWSVTPGGAMRARPALAGSAVYIGDRSGNVFALDQGSGQVAWTKTTKGELLANPTVVGDLVLFAPFGGTNLLEAYSTSGEFKWAYAPGK